MRSDRVWGRVSARVRRRTAGGGSGSGIPAGPRVLGRLLRQDELLTRAAQVRGLGEPDHAITRLMGVANGLWLAGLQILQGGGFPGEHRARGRAQAVEEQLQVATDETVEARAAGTR
ncbi:hypothetical protein SBRY_30214 [Actinacidiphila bryophytorum]|uniref:Uncharacterized protein n=1 Tax=Actinacidiphila bryophytorum TaxID=1436133 RepID=A0A9W4MEM0_9ACTN|nr:hypothetical protein SBRY_30214 [Actinacidiphila bryophytorum]